MTPYLLNALPNTGSTWLGDIVGRALGPHHLEYFNPAQNFAREAQLVRRFGCEFRCCYENIVVGSSPEVDQDITKTFFAEPIRLRFTKEVFSPFKLESFTRRFACAILTRDPDGIFPPKRGRIWCFYEHAWFALAEAQWAGLRGDTDVRSRARKASAIMEGVLVHDARRLGVPRIRYEMLFEPASVVHEHLRPWLGAEWRVLDRVVDEIVRTRKRKDIT